MTNDMHEEALAKMNRPMDVTFTVPLKLSVALIALAESNGLEKDHGSALLEMKKQVASQLSG